MEIYTFSIDDILKISQPISSLQFLQEIGQRQLPKTISFLAGAFTRPDVTLPIMQETVDIHRKRWTTTNS